MLSTQNILVIVGSILLGFSVTSIWGLFGLAMAFGVQMIWWGFQIAEDRVDKARHDEMLQAIRSQQYGD